MKAEIILVSYMIYSVIGYVYESLLCSVREKRFVKRGICYGPYCPIYGTCMITTYAVVYALGLHNIFVIFVMAVIVNSVIEYLLNILVDKACGYKMWDYSWRKYNIKGRVCLAGAVVFGIASTVMCRFVQPMLNEILSKVESSKLLIIGIVLCMVALCDMMISLVSINFFEKIKVPLKSLF